MAGLAVLLEWIYMLSGVLFLICFKFTHHNNAFWILVVIGGSVLVRQICIRRIRELKTGIALLMLIGGLIAVFLHDPLMVMLYPLAVNLALFSVFATSLAGDETIIQKMVRVRRGDLDPATKAYTRSLTKAWTALIGINSCVTAYTIWLHDMDVWSLYNGCISYIVLGVFAAVEFVFRHFYRRRFGIA